MARINDLSMSLVEMMIALADGNPGAATAMAEIAKSAATIDPDNAFRAFGPIMMLDTLSIYGSNIWVLFKDICSQEPAKMLAVLRAVQLGIMPEDELHNGIMMNHLGNAREENDARVNALFAAVREQLPAFAASEGIVNDG